MAKENVFEFETRIDELFETVYPAFAAGDSAHPSGRACKPILASTLGALVPDGTNSRRLQRRREYVKVDFLDFIDYATSPLPPQPRLGDFPEHTAVFYESISPEKPAQWGRWGNHSFAITDCVVARDRVFVTVMMRFAVRFNLEDARTDTEEIGITIIFAPESYSVQTQVAGPLGEWERATWFPPIKEDGEFRFVNSGEYTSYLIEAMEAETNATSSPEFLAKLRDNREANNTTWGAFFEIARLGLHLPSYIDFMYDLVVIERKLVGAKAPKNRLPRRGKAVSFDRPVYKIIRSVRIIRPESPSAIQPEFRQWTAPSYCFLVHGHWRNFQDQSRKGRDAEGNVISGKTWVREYHKFKELGDREFEAELKTTNPQVVIGVKQTLSYARDVIDAHSRQGQSPEGKTPTQEWIANERAKLTAGLRYLILKRDGFRCCKCGKSQADANYVRLEVDHKIPVSQWGRTIEGNLETLCRDCNQGKADDV